MNIFLKLLLETGLEASSFNLSDAFCIKAALTSYRFGKGQCFY